jgi:hypothetical protein
LWLWSYWGCKMGEGCWCGAGYRQWLNIGIDWTDTVWKLPELRHILCCARTGVTNNTGASAFGTWSRKLARACLVGCNPACWCGLIQAPLITRFQHLPSFVVFACRISYVLEPPSCHILDVVMFLQGCRVFAVLRCSVRNDWQHRTCGYFLTCTMES